MAGRRRRRRAPVAHRPTAAGTGVTVLAGLAVLIWLFVDEPAVIALAAAVMVALVVDAVFADLAVRPTAVELHGPESVVENEPIPWSVRVWGCSRPVLLTLQAMPGAEPVLATDAEAGILSGPGFGRGAVPFAVVDTTATGPLGLAKAGRRTVVPLGHPTLVVPAAIRADTAWPQPRAVRFGLADHAPLGDDLFRSVRPYVPGDERRRVNWHATARHGQLMVRESDGTGLVHLRVVCDLGPPGPLGDGIARMTLAVVSQALARGWEVELVSLLAPGAGVTLLSEERVFTGAPVMTLPAYESFPTSQVIVHSSLEAARLLALAPPGSPVLPSAAPKGRTCTVSPVGVVWS